MIDGAREPICASLGTLQPRASRVPKTRRHIDTASNLYLDLVDSTVCLYIVHLQTKALRSKVMAKKRLFFAALLAGTVGPTTTEHEGPV